MDDLLDPFVRLSVVDPHGAYSGEWSRRSIDHVRFLTPNKPGHPHFGHFMVLCDRSSMTPLATFLRGRGWHWLNSGGTSVRCGPYLILAVMRRGLRDVAEQIRQLQMEEEREKLARN